MKNKKSLLHCLLTTPVIALLMLLLSGVFSQDVLFPAVRTEAYSESPNYRITAGLIIVAESQCTVITRLQDMLYLFAYQAVFFC